MPAARCPQRADIAVKLALIDHFAHTGDSVLHRLPTGHKLVAAGLVLAAAISADHVAPSLLLYAALLALARASRCPLQALLLASLYPTLFVLLVTLGGGLELATTGVLLLSRALSSTLVAVLLLATTPYPELIAVGGRWLPPLLRQSLLLCYRALFLMLSLLDDIRTALRLRGNRNLPAAMALFVVRGFDLAEEQYSVMRLRGVDGGALAYNPRQRGSQWAGWLAVAAAATALVAVLWHREG